MNTAENNVQRDAAPAIEVRELVKRYADKLALDYLNMNVRTGEIYGLLGPNGSGKTTAINCILGLLTYDSGQIRAFGGKMGPTAYDLKRRIGVVPQDVAVFNELTVQENIEYFCSLYVADKTRRARLVDEAIEFVGLEDYRRFRPRKLSGGLLRRLNIACGKCTNPNSSSSTSQRWRWIRKAATRFSKASNGSTNVARPSCTRAITWRRSSRSATASRS